MGVNYVLLKDEIVTRRDPYSSGVQCPYTGHNVQSLRSCNCYVHRISKHHSYNKDYYSYTRECGDTNLKRSRSMELLGIEPPLTFENLKCQYRKKALEYHPDKPSGDTEMFIKIKDAFDTLEILV
jgi:hypothetical protein